MRGVEIQQTEVYDSNNNEYLTREKEREKKNHKWMENWLVAQNDKLK